MVTHQVSKDSVKGAANWFARLTADDVTAADQEAFLHWVEEDPTHRAAYEQVSAAWMSVDALDKSALEEFAEQTTSLPQGLSWIPAWTSGRTAAAAVLGSFAIVLSVVVVQSSFSFTKPTEVFYETLRGDRREITLEDGTVVTLNTATKVEASFSARKRRVELVAGEAFFNVAPDADKPFEISAGPGVVTVLGTHFNVRLDDAVMNVAVIEGRVSLGSSAARKEPPVVLTAGDGGSIGYTDGLYLYDVTDDDSVVAWREGRFVFRDTPLSEVVKEINRYSSQPVIVEGPSVIDLEINGVFSTDRIPELLTTLSKIAPVEVVGLDGDDQIIIRSGESN